MANLSAAQILGIKPKVLAVNVPEWNGSVFIRELLANERDWFEAWQLGADNNPERFKGVRAKIVSYCLCDESGTRLFSDGDAARLGDLPARGLDTVFTAILDLNALNGSSMKEAEKN